MMDVKHTPTPWTINPSAGLGVTIRAADGVKPVVEVWANGDDYAANAELIVRSVNSHDDLVAALKWALAHVQAPKLIQGQNEAHFKAYQFAHAALSKAALPTSPD